MADHDVMLLPAVALPEGTSEEVLGDRTSYPYQLARLADSLQGGAALPNRDGSVANAELIDECYRRARLSPRAS